MATQYGEDIAVLKDQMKDVKDALTRIETKQDAQAALYATKQELRSFKWITVPVVIIVTAVLTGLVYFYLSHGKTITPETTTATNNTTNPGVAASSGTANVPSTSSTATTHSDAANPAASQTDNGGVTLTLPKVTP